MLREPAWEKERHIDRVILSEDLVPRIHYLGSCNDERIHNDEIIGFA